jgi:hypothetical protein
MTEIPFAELFAFCWIPDPAFLAGLFGYALFAVALITLITAPVTLKPRRPTRLPRRSALVGGVR